MSYATPTIRAELRRHFRDSGWAVRPPLRVQELQASISRADEELMARRGRSPRPAELAAHLEAPVDDVIEALTADACFVPTSLDHLSGDGTSTLCDLIGIEDFDQARLEAVIVLQPLLDRLDEREREVLKPRFQEDRTQQDIAQSIGVTQAQVSRILRKILGSCDES